MNITRKQLMDIISLAVLSVSTEYDSTVKTRDNYSTFEQELGHILHVVEDEDMRTVEMANRHVAAIRLGMKIAQS